MTIIATATPNGTGAIAIVRLSGPKAYDLAMAMISPKCKLAKNSQNLENSKKQTEQDLAKNTQNSTNNSEYKTENFKNLENFKSLENFKNPAENSKNFTNLKELKPRYAHLCKLYSQKGELIDEAIVIYFKAPYSFSGEDIIEFQTHGGDAVKNAIIDELLSLGARAANPGEFSKRAFINGKLSVSKAESVQALIHARSASAAKILARAMDGELDSFANTLRAWLIEILAYCEVSIDYAEDDLPPSILEQIRIKLENAVKKLERIVEISLSRRGLIDGFKIAIIGRPNVGKSSLLNAFLAYERAIVSDIEGTTRDRVEESLHLGSHLVRVIDTAGIRASNDVIENIGIKYSKKAVNDADIVICLFDASKEATKDDLEILELAKNSNKKIFFVLNKCDLGVNFNEKLLNKSIKISVKDDIDELKKALISYLDTQDTSELLLSSNRQIQACQNSATAIKNASLKLNENELEIFAFEINKALKELGKITAPPLHSEILDAMFSSFCLGK